MKTIKLARVRAGLTQEQLAERAGITENTISGIELGRHKPRGRTLFKLADALGVDVTELLEDAGPKGKAPRSASEYVNEQGGITRNRTASSHVGRITSSSHARVEVDAESLRAALQGVEAGLLTAEEAEERLLAGVS